MKYRQLADTGVFVSELCLGAMTFGGQGQIWENIGGLDQSAADGIVHHALDEGINFIDTANVYSAGESETMVGKALAGRRHGVVLATKVRGRMGQGPNEVGLSRLHIMEAVEASLKRLGTDYIDLYQIHRFDPLTAIDDTLRALDDLVRAGKVRYIGCSNFYGWQIARSNGVAALKGYEPLVSAQHLYNMVRRDIERDGFISIGDVGYLDEDGYLFLCDRKHDMVISGGVNVYPAEIEAALLVLPGVRDCAVFGIPHEEFGETLCAHIEPEPGAVLKESAVRSFLRERLADFKIPRVIRFETNLPREDSGKIMKRKLRDPYWEATGRRI